MSFQLRAKKLTGNRGFSLVEMLISMMIFTIVMGMIYAYLLNTKKTVISTEQELEAVDNAQNAVNALREDLGRIGYGCDRLNNQPRILLCTPYEIIFCADLDRNSQNPSDRYGAYINGMNEPYFSPIRRFIKAGTSSPPGSGGEAPGDWGWETSQIYGNGTDGAEIVRYSLDYTGDSAVLPDDTEDQIASIELGVTHNQNPSDFWLIKEWWGVHADSITGTVANAYSGRHPVAFNIRGNLFSYTSTSPIDPDYLYPRPDNKYPQFIFTYWGHFIDTITPNNASGQPDWDGEPLDLWGDWGGITNPEIAYTSGIAQGIGPGGANNGILDQNEIQAMLQNSNIIGRVRVLFPENGSDIDLNGNGITSETRLEQVIRRIGVTITTETGTMDFENPDPLHSDFSSSPAVKYPYRDYTLSISVNPENLRYEGAPAIMQTPVPPTPLITTPIPTIPPATPGPGSPSHTPVPTDTPAPNPTPTPTPGNSDYRNDEIVIGCRQSLYVVGLSRSETNPSELCLNSQGRGYWLDYLNVSVVDLLSVNFCNLANYPDKWNDLVYATNDQLNNNIFYMKHRPYAGVDGFEKRNAIRIGSVGNYIVKLARGNIDAINATNDYYPEIFVAYYDQVLDVSYINYIRISGTCGDLLSPECAPYQLSGLVTDMEMVDYNNDSKAELAVITNRTSGSQLYIFDQLSSCPLTGWSIALEIPDLYSGDFPYRIDSGNFLSSQKQYPDLFVISQNGDVRIIENVSGIYNDIPCTAPSLTDHWGIKDMVVFPPARSATFYDQAAAVSTNPDHTLTVFNSIGNCPQIFEKLDCSGTIPDTSPIATYWIEMEHGGVIVPTLLILNRNSSGFINLKVMGNPCEAVFPDNICEIPLSFLNSVSCMTSTRNNRTDDFTTASTAKSDPINKPAIHDFGNGDSNTQSQMNSHVGSELKQQPKKPSAGFQDKRPR